MYEGTLLLEEPFKILITISTEKNQPNRTLILR